MQAGPGLQRVAQAQDLLSDMSSPLSPEFQVGGAEVVETAPALKRPVLLIGDSMAQCIPSTDSTFMPVTKDGY